MLAELEIRLESDKIIKRTLIVLFSQLYNGIRPSARSRIGKSHRLHTAVADALNATLCKHFNRHTPLIHLQILKALERYALCVNKLIVKCLILFPCHRAVYIIRLALVIACCKKRKAHINTLRRNYRSSRIIEAKRFTAALLYLLGKIIACQRSCSNDRVLFGELSNLAVYHLYIRM